jgi:hypothetical protein
MKILLWYLHMSFLVLNNSLPQWPPDSPNFKHLRIAAINCGAGYENQTRASCLGSKRTIIILIPLNSYYEGRSKVAY